MEKQKSTDEGWGTNICIENGLKFDIIKQKSTESVRKIGYGQSLILTRCVVSNGFNKIII